MFVALADAHRVEHARSVWSDARKAGHMRRPLQGIRFGHVNVRGQGLSSSAISLILYDALHQLREAVVVKQAHVPDGLRVYHDAHSRDHIKAVLGGMDPPMAARMAGTGNRYLAVSPEDVLSFLTSAGDADDDDDDAGATDSDAEWYGAGAGGGGGYGSQRSAAPRPYM